MELEFELGVLREHAVAWVQLTLVNSDRLVTRQVQIKHHRSISQQHHFDFRQVHSAHSFILQQEKPRGCCGLEQKDLH